MGELSNFIFPLNASGLAGNKVRKINRIGADKWHAEKLLVAVLSQTS
jgi:hypothetical protein